MAKFEEADPRWLVKDLGATGTNVNGWHWVERDAMEWSKQRLSELFSGVELLLAASDSGMQLAVTGLDSVTGEAIINNRKQKIIPSYELEIKLNWEGSVGGQAVKGKLHFPYVADENHDEDPELKFVVSTDETASNQLKQAFLNGAAKKKVVDLIHQFVKELRAGGPALQPTSTTQQPTATTTTATTKLTSAPAPTTAVPPAAAKGGKGQQLKLKEQFYCRAADLYECFTNENRLKAFTQSGASVEPKVGGSFSWFSGSVQGTFTVLESGKQIGMQWRFSSWEDDCFSKVDLSIEEPEPGHTVVTLTQTEIPEVNKFGSEDVLETTEKGWKMQIFQRIRQVFGYGVGL